VNPDEIRVRPVPMQRIAFAQWAVAQRPKLRTINPYEFAVPAALFAGMPEDLLIGSTVNGHPYVSPVEGAANGQEPPGAAAPDLLGVATPEGLAAPQEPAGGPATADPRQGRDAVVINTDGVDPARLRAAMDAALLAADVATANADDDAGSPLPVPDDSDSSDPPADRPEGVSPVTVATGSSRPGAAGTPTAAWCTPRRADVPVQPLPCGSGGDGRPDVEQTLLCDVLADGSIAGTALAVYEYDSDGNPTGPPTFVDPATGPLRGAGRLAAVPR
jgi:hypothetical protein